MRNNPKQNNRLDHPPDLGAIFDKHVKCEFEDHDVDATMKTMVKEPYVLGFRYEWNHQIKITLHREQFCYHFQ